MNNAQELKAHLQDNNKARMYEEKKKKDKTFHITISELTAKTIKVKAANKDMAWNKIKDDGYWEYEQIGNNKCVEWEFADCKEVKKDKHQKDREDKLVKTWQDEIAMKKGEGK